MRLVAILTLGLGVFGPTLVNAEKVIFVVPRYVRRSFTAGPTTPFYNHGDPVYKTRPSIRGPSQPYFSGHYEDRPMIDEPIFPGEKSRFHQDAGDFEPNLHRTREAVNHVMIPHGKGISHAISFGKPYIPREEFKSENYNFEFPTGNGNNLNYAGHENHQGDLTFGNDDYPGFQNQYEDPGTKNVDWPFPQGESSYSTIGYGQETNQDESKLELQDVYKGQRMSAAPKEEFFFPKATNGEEPRTFFEKDASPAGVFDHSRGSGSPMITVEVKPKPIILQDTVDMREYVEKIEAFAKSWPHAAALQSIGWKNGILNPPGLDAANFKGFGSWSSNVHRAPSNGYEVQEKPEESSRRSFGTTRP